MRSARGLLTVALAFLSFGFALQALTIGAWDNLAVDLPNMIGPAWDCVRTGDCVTRLSSSGMTSRLGLPHGAGYLDLLILVEALGGGLEHVALALALLFALSAAVVFAIGARLVGPLLALLGAGFYVGYMVGLQGFNLDWLGNPLMSPLPAALFLAMAVAYAATARTGYLLLAAALWAFGVQVHLAWLFYGVSLVVLVALEGRGRMVALLVSAALVAIASAQGLSPAMLMDTAFLAHRLQGMGSTVPHMESGLAVFRFSLIAVLSLGLVMLCGRRVLRARAGRWAVGRFLLLGGVPAILVFLWVGRGATYYAFPIAPMVALMAVMALAVLSGWLGARMRRALPGAPGWWQRQERHAWLGRTLSALVVVASLGWAGWQARGAWLGIQAVVPRPGGEPRSGDSFFSARSLAELLGERLGLTFEEAYSRIRGVDQPLLLLTGQSLFLPSATAAAEAGSGGGFAEDLVLVRGRSADRELPTPPGWLRHESRDGLVWWLLRHRPWLRWERYDVCAWAATEPTRCRWQRVEHRFSPHVSPVDRERLHVRQFLASWNPDARVGPGVLVRVPVRMPPTGPPRVVVAPLGSRPGVGMPRGGLIVASEGLPVEGALPAGQVTLRPDGTESEGWLLLAWEIPLEVTTIPQSVVELDPEAWRHVARLPEASGILAPSAPDIDLPSPAQAAAFLADERFELVLRGRPPALPEPLVPLWYVWVVFGVHVLLFVSAFVLVFMTRRFPWRRVGQGGEG